MLRATRRRARLYRQSRVEHRCSARHGPSASGELRGGAISIRPQDGRVSLTGCPATGKKRENRELAGKLNDPGIKREMAGNFAKRRKIWKFSFNYYLKKKNCGVHFCFSFFKEKNIFFKLSTIYKIYLLNCIPWGEGSKYYIKKLNFSLNLLATLRDFSGEEIRKNRALAGNLKMGNS